MSTEVQRPTVKNLPSPIQSSHVENANSLRLGEVVMAAWRYRWSAILLPFLLLPLFVILVFLIPVKYDSSAKLLVRLGRGAVSIDPTANLSQTVSLQESRLAQVNSVKELLSGRELVERVVTRIGAARILEPHGVVEETIDFFVGTFVPAARTKAQGDLSIGEVVDQIQLEEACKAVSESISISAPKDAYTVSIQIRTGDPFLSRDLIQAYVEEYAKYHVESHQSIGSLEFFENQAVTSRKRANDTQAALRDAKTERGIVDLAGAKLSLGTAISNIKFELLATDSRLASLESELNNLKAQIGVMPEQVETEVTHGIAKVAGSAMRQRLYDLEVSAEELAVRLTPDHPKLVNIREQIKAASQIAKTEEGDQLQSRESINPIRQQLELAYKQSAASLAGTVTKREALIGQLKTLTEDLAKLNQDEVTLNQLAWEASLAESEFLRSATARSTARQISDLDTQHLSEISIVQPATLSLKKATPKRAILLVLAAALAMAMSLGQAILRGLIFDQPTPAPVPAFDRFQRPVEEVGTLRHRAWDETELDDDPSPIEVHKELARSR